MQPAARDAEIMDDFRHIADECFGIQRRESFQAFACQFGQFVLYGDGKGRIGWKEAHRLTHLARILSKQPQLFGSQQPVEFARAGGRK